MLTFQHLQLSNFNNADDLQKRLVLFVEGVNTYLAQRSRRRRSLAKSGGCGSPVTASHQQGVSADSRHHV